MKIQYIPNPSINRKKWDNAIELASNGFPYAYSWYLDMSCNGQWDALIEGDYEVVMPLPWNSKLLGIKQIFQPILSQQLGVFGKNLSDEKISTFLKSIPKQFKLVQLKINEKNKLPLFDKKKEYLKQRSNYVLPLNMAYEQIWNNYSKSLRKRLRKAKALLRVQETQDIKLLVHFYRQNLATKVHLSQATYSKIEHLITKVLQHKKGKIFAVYPSNNSTACSVGCFLYSHQRIINIFGASNSQGKSLQSMHFLLDYLIEQNAPSKWLFDFEGSEIKGIADFFKSFGSEKRLYFEYFKNDLPILLQWVKIGKNWLK